MTVAVPVLMYHHVCPSPGLVTVSPDIFEQHMAYLARHGYRALAADEFLEFLQGRRALTGRNVLITFDDGYLDNYVYAYPILKRYGLRATVFAITGQVGDGAARAHADAGTALPVTPDHRGCKVAVAEGRADDVMLRWSEIEAMEASRTVEVHSHTHTHQRWDRLYADEKERLAAVHADLAASRATLQAHLGKASRHLCWPWGYFGPGYRETAQRLGFVAQYATAKAINTPGIDLHQIGRVVAKARAGTWLGMRLAIYRRPWLGRLYLRLRGA